jgi:hypothetical protein
VIYFNLSNSVPTVYSLAALVLLLSNWLIDAICQVAYFDPCSDLQQQATSINTNEKGKIETHAFVANGTVRMADYNSTRNLLNYCVKRDFGEYMCIRIGLCMTKGHARMCRISSDKALYI